MSYYPNKPCAYKVHPPCSQIPYFQSHLITKVDMSTGNQLLRHIHNHSQTWAEHTKAKTTNPLVVNCYRVHC